MWPEGLCAGSGDVNLSFRDLGELMIGIAFFLCSLQQLGSGFFPESIS